VWPVRGAVGDNFTELGTRCHNNKIGQVSTMIPIQTEVNHILQEGNIISPADMKERQVAIALPPFGSAMFHPPHIQKHRQDP
jgi:hypothetical protein